MKIDEVDKRIIYRLRMNAKEIKAPQIAKEMNVSPATIRNRINKLRKNGIIKGYHAHIAFDQIENKLITLYKCSTPSIGNRSNMAKRALDLDNVIHIREIMSGNRENLHIKAIVNNTKEATETANKLENIGLEILDETLINKEYFSSYNRYGSREEPEDRIINLKKLRGGSEIANIILKEKNLISNKKIKNVSNILSENCLIISVEREDKTISPNGETVLKPGDIISVFSSTGIDKETLKPFIKEKNSK